jgi:hypothetical protein
VPILAETFYLSEGEKQLLVSSDVGEGIFFAGQNHVALRVVASPDEYGLITTNPEEILKQRNSNQIADQGGSPITQSVRAGLTAGIPLQGNMGGGAPMRPPQFQNQSQNLPLAPQPGNPLNTVQTRRVQIPTTQAAAPTPQPVQTATANGSGIPEPKQYAGTFTIDDYQPPK